MIIHLIAAGKYQDQKNWPEIWSRCYSTLQSLPYQIKIWNDEEIDNLIKQDDQDFCNVLNTLPLIYKWDYVRYIMMRDYGGAYIDMDVEIINNFIPLLNPNKLYLMEGTSGCYIENSIMVNINSQPYFWDDLKNFIKNKIYLNIKKSKDPKNVISITGAMAMSEFIVKEEMQRYGIQLEILSRYHFASLTNEICFTRHYNTTSWLN